MIYILLILLVYCSLVSCANDLFGAERIVYQNGFYVERWYLNPEYGQEDIPKGTNFYGVSAERNKYKFIVKYYIEDNKDSKVQIPTDHMWKVNGDTMIDDNEYFYYEYVGDGVYSKYKAGNSEIYLKIKEEYILPVEFCEDGWCKLYPNAYSDNLYVRETILMNPLE